MMRRNPLKIAATSLLGAFALFQAADAFGQSTGASIGAPRSRDERVVTEGPVPKTANSVARDAAEGRLPAVPPQVAPGAGAGAIVPGARGRVVPGQQLDPAVRLQPPVLAPGAARAAVMAGSPAGMDVAMLIEHAVGMAIEGSALQAIAQASGPNDDPANPANMLLNHARKEMQESKGLLTQAAADGRDIPATSPSRRFYNAANGYVTTLAGMAASTAPMSPADTAQVAFINHSVKSVLDADHILQMGRASAGSVATEQLIGHARDMREGGAQRVMKLAGNGPALDPATAPSPVLLAQRGQELLAAAEQLNASMNLPAAMAPARGNLAPGAPARGNLAPGALAPGANPASSVYVPGSNVGALRDVRPEIIGGTQATGSPTAGTATGAEAAANVKNSRELPNGELVVPTPSGKPGTGISNYGVGNNNTPPTNSTGGLPPR